MTFLKLAKEVALEAGALINSYVGTSLKVKEKDSSFDVVTDIDNTTEMLIKRRFSEATPQHKFLGEEESFDNKDNLKERIKQAQSEEYTWIIDPIDGTSNFVQEVPIYSVSIALAHYGEIILGVIYDPSHDELYYAEKDKGAFMNGEPISVSMTTKLNQSVIGTGFTTKPDARVKNLAAHQTLSVHCRSIRAFGSAALHSAFVASGKLTAFVQHGLYIWDTAAGALLIQEAGGKVTDTKGSLFDLNTENIFFSNGNVHEELLSHLNVTYSTSE